VRPDATTIPQRAGPRPRTTPHAPHSQIDQIPPRGQGAALSRRLIEQVSDLAHVQLGGSYRAPPGTVGLHLDAAHACTAERAFLLGREFAHVHVEDDFSLHAILPEPLRSDAIAAGWAEPHPFAGEPTVSPDTVMIYAPRDDTELAVVVDLVRQSWKNAHV
jgi:hypothetical protein